MSQLKISKTEFALVSLSQTSFSPSESSTTEDGVITYTYTTDAQRYEFDLKGFTTTHEQYAQFTAKMEQVSNSDTFLLDLYSWGDGLFPFFGDITNKVYTTGAHTAGASVITYDHTTSNPSGVVPNGEFGVADFVKFKGATYDKLYRIISVDTSAHTYTIYPSLRENISDETEFLYGDDVDVRVRMKKDTLKFSSKGSVPQKRDYSLSVTEDYTSTT